MKNWIRTLTLLLSLSSPAALAAQYQIFVAHPANSETLELPAQDLLQKTIYVDTATRTVRVPVTSPCLAGQICGESAHWSVYQMSSLETSGRTLNRIVAVAESAEIEISLNADHSTLITLSNSKGSVRVSYIGSPAEPARFFN